MRSRCIYYKYVLFILASPNSVNMALCPNFSENIVSFEFFLKGDSCIIMAVLESPSVWE